MDSVGYCTSSKYPCTWDPFRYNKKNKKKKMCMCPHTTDCIYISGAPTFYIYISVYLHIGVLILLMSPSRCPHLHTCRCIYISVCLHIGCPDTFCIYISVSSSTSTYRCVYSSRYRCIYLPAAPSGTLWQPQQPSRLSESV